MGLSAYFWQRWTVWSVGGLALCGVGLLVIVFVDFPFLSGRWWTFIPLLLSVLLINIGRIAGAVQKSRELALGYTTILALAGQQLDLRDPHTGRVLLRAGQAMPADVKTLGSLRLVASTSQMDEREPGQEREESAIRSPRLTTQSGARTFHGLATPLAATIFVFFLVLLAVRLVLISSHLSWAGVVVFGVSLMFLGVFFGIMILISSLSAYRRMAALRSVALADFFVAAYRTIELVQLVHLLAPASPVRQNMVWSIDKDGCTLWSVGRDAESVLAIPWAAVQSIDVGTAHSGVGSSAFTAIDIAFRLRDTVHHVLFFARRASIPDIRTSQKFAAEIAQQLTACIPR